MTNANHTIERLTDPDAYLITLHSSFEPATDMRPYYIELSDLLDTETTPIASIVDVRETEITFTRLLAATRELQDLDVNPTKHAMSKMFIIVSENKLMKASMDGFRRFGIVRDARIVHTVEDALRVIEEDDNGNAEETRPA